MSSGILGGIIAAALISLMAWWSSRRKPGSPPPTSAYCRGPMLIFMTVGVALGVALFGLMVYSALIGNPTVTWLLVLGFGVFAAAGCVMGWDVYTRRIDWSDTEVRFRKWGRVRTLSWNEIASLNYKAVRQFTRVAFRDGGGFAIPEYLIGGRDFVAKAIEHGKPYTM
jgi:hypothetical protein